MRTPEPPLSEDESLEAAALLKQGGAPSLTFARGVFAAAATAPTQLSPTQWMPLVLGRETPDALTLKRLLALLMRDYNSCAECLALAVPAVPDAADQTGIRDFARGYVQVAQKDQAWTRDAEAFELTAPLMALSGYAELKAIGVLDAAAAKDPDAYVNQHRLGLVDDVAALYAHFEPARKKAALADSAKPEKVGRNAPCPCGSGKKYKRCCAT